MTKVTQAHIAARTGDILDAATRLFATKGIDATTMQEIAAEAGISAGAIYPQAWFEQAARSSDSPLEALLELGREAWEDLNVRTPEHLILGLETTLAAVRKPDELRSGQRHLANAVITGMEQLVRQAQAAGEVDPHSSRARSP